MNSEEITQEINELKERLKEVKGTKTEVYTRICGYHRNVQAWNEGAKARYKDTKEFKYSTKDIKEKKEVKRKLYFYGVNCPKCKDPREVMEETPEMECVNVNTPEGLEIARKYMVMSTPTYLNLDENDSPI